MRAKDVLIPTDDTKATVLNGFLELCHCGFGQRLVRLDYPFLDCDGVAQHLHLAET